jgi:hypothetical protein
MPPDGIPIASQVSPGLSLLPLRGLPGFDMPARGNSMAKDDYDSVSPRYFGHLKFQQAIDLCGKLTVVDLAGTNFRLGVERDRHLPVLFHLPDGRYFYGRYDGRGFLEFRYRPRGAICTLQQMSLQHAMLQGEKEGIPLPPKPGAGSDSPSASSGSQIEPSAAITTSNPEASTPRPGPVSDSQSAKPKKPRKRKPATKADAIVSFLDAANDAGYWGMSAEEIAKRAGSTGRYFRALRKNDPSVQDAYNRYLRASQGRGPSRPSEL